MIRAIILWLIGMAVLCVWAAHAQSEPYTMDQSVTVPVSATVSDACWMNEDEEWCDIVVIPLTEADLAAQPMTPKEQYQAAAKWQQIEPAGGD